ncbi:hypothetical protein NDU88_004378 [Pleurodeles waltl]|uniref:Uncharacterized protein n=1 Tax=Pleurodeles waltl TaxID=8319 RepID=A0AAV7T9J5_PLEWA|nr:hypothetical protein NDU88_004378 [Pleurodeles waltl]
MQTSDSGKMPHLRTEPSQLCRRPTKPGTEPTPGQPKSKGSTSPAPDWPNSRNEAQDRHNSARRVLLAVHPAESLQRTRRGATHPRRRGDPLARLQTALWRAGAPPARPLQHSPRRSLQMSDAKHGGGGAGRAAAGGGRVQSHRTASLPAAGSARPQRYPDLHWLCKISLTARLPCLQLAAPALRGLQIYTGFAKSASLHLSPVCSWQRPPSEVSRFTLALQDQSHRRAPLPVPGSARPQRSPDLH